MTENRPLKVFLCHSSADKPAVRELYKKLRAEPWIEPWLDEEELFPGMDWNMEIEKAIEATDVILVCLSNNSITKEGYVQREIRIALDYADYKPEGTLFIIPVRLEECTPPKRLSRWQYADYFEGQRERGLQRLLVSLQRRTESLGLNTETLAPSNAPPQSAPSQSPITNQLITNKLTLSNGMEFMHVPAGRFLMGSTEDNKSAFEEEQPQHVVDIPYDYWMARFPVTNKLYNTYVKSKGMKHHDDDWEKKKDHPVVSVQRAVAMEYCQWLNNLFKAELPAGLVLRLPIEAEWEKAARGTNGLEYPWGNSFDENKCNTLEGGRSHSTPVGSYSPQGDSPFGCADMAGNVFELMHSFKKAYPYKINEEHDDENASGARLLRGGSFDSDKRYARCASRSDSSIDLFSYLALFIKSVGFRVVASSPLPK